MIKINSKNNSLSHLTEDFDKTPLLAVGEIHGVKENAELYKTLIKLLDIDTVALEYPVSAQELLLIFLKTGEYPDHYAFKELADGRINTEMLVMLKELYDSGQIKDIICFDNEIDIKHWNERDKEYANVFLTAHEKLDNPRTIIIAGRMHVRPTPFSIETDNKMEQGELYSMVYHLRKVIGHFPIININYSNGAIIILELLRLRIMSSIKM